MLQWKPLKLSCATIKARQSAKEAISRTVSVEMPYQPVVEIENSDSMEPFAKLLQECQMCQGATSVVPNEPQDQIGL
jgi:hypothetical protein